jgi:hypothetical protein
MHARRQRLEQIVNCFLVTKRVDLTFTPNDAQFLCQSITPVLLAEPTLLRLKAPLNIVGDVHGQLADLVRAFDTGGVPPLQAWLFLGDYADGQKRLFGNRSLILKMDSSPLKEIRTTVV